jgi:small subunit ribosomal protein S16
VPVRIRMKKMGKKARPFFRIVVVDSRSPRDGKVIEELGHYDPMVPDTDARVSLKRERVDYWLGVGAQPTEKTSVLIKKYGSSGTHLAKQEAAVAKLTAIRNRRRPSVTTSKESSPAEAAAE